MSTVEKMDKLSRQLHAVQSEMRAVWREEIFLADWHWWFGLVLTIAAWLFWIRYHQKASRDRLLYAGFFVGLISVFLDSIGVRIGLWSYRYEVTPFIPAYIPYDFALMPVVIMSLIQFRPSVSPYKKSIVFGLLSAFVGEPVIVWLDIYKLLMWEFYYSVPIYTAIYLAANWLVNKDKFERIERAPG